MSFAREIVFISNAKMYSYVDYTVFIPIVVCLMPIVRMSHAGLPYPSFVTIYTLQQADST